MNKKKAFQISLIVLFVFSCLIFYKKYFFSNVTVVSTKIDKVSDNEKNEAEKKKMKKPMSQKT